MSPPVLYTYFRSSAAWRVRIALNLKEIAYEARPVHLTREGGEQVRAGYRAVNPQGLVPTLIDGDATVTQSLAIIEYLEETHPAPALLPANPKARAAVRAMAQAIACDIHPIDNLRVLNYLRGEMAADEAAVSRWYRHWIAEGFAALERLATPVAGAFCHGDMVTIADLCLVPQMFNARRFDCDLSAFSRLVAIDERCRAIPAFAAAAPENQPDRE